jgi:hypothetical protein
MYIALNRRHTLVLHVNVVSLVPSAFRSYSTHYIYIQLASWYHHDDRVCKCSWRCHAVPAEIDEAKELQGVISAIQVAGRNTYLPLATRCLAGLTGGDAAIASVA